MQTAEQIVSRNNKEILTIDENTLLIDAVKLMSNKKVGSIFIKKDKKIIGVWTERDLLKKLRII